MDERLKSLKSVLAKPRRVILDLEGRPRMAALILAIEGDVLKVYQRKSAGGAGFYRLPLVTINSVWDKDVGGCVWRKP